MVPEKWQIEEEKQMEDGRIMAKVLVGTNNKENVYEFMYKDILMRVIDGTYEYNDFVKSTPPVVVYYKDKLIPHNAGILSLKEEVKEKMGYVPFKFILKSLKNKKAASDDYAISRLFDQKYNAELIRLCVREVMEEEVKKC